MDTDPHLPTRTGGGDTDTGAPGHRSARGPSLPAMRILQVAPPWFPVPPPRYGGTEQIVGTLSEGLAQRGHEVTVLTTGDATVATTRWSAYDVAPTAQIGDWRVELAHLMDGYQRPAQFDVIHDHTLLGATIAAMATPHPIVHTLHGQWSTEAADVCRRLPKRVHLVAISNDQANRAPPGIEITRVIHNGVELARFPFAGETEGYLAFIGRASPEKAPHLAVEVARALGRRLVMAVKLNEPAEQRYWQEQVAPLLETHDVSVVVNANHAQKVEVLRGAAVLLFPIQWPEPFGLVPVEANACGTPVVAFANGAVPEVVKHGRGGILVDPADGVDGLVAAVDQAEGLSRLGCRRHAVEHFSARRMVDGYERLYRQLVAADAAPEETRSSTQDAMPSRTGASVTEA